MKQFIIFVLFVSITSYGFSQDRIITIENDTIHCKITRVTDSHLHYLLPTDGIRSRIGLDEVESYFQAEEIVEQEEELEVKKEEEEEYNIDDEVLNLPNYGEVVPLTPFRIAISTGFSYQYAGYENFPNSYTRQVRSLWNRGLAGHYFINNNLGIGVEYNRVSTSAEEEFIGNITNIVEDIRFDFVALSVLSRKPASTDGGIIYYGIGLGLITYNDSGTIDGNPFTEFGETFGLSLNLGYDHAFNDEFGVGVNLGVTLGSLNEITVNGNTFSGVNFGVSRIDLTAGIRIFQ